MNILLCPDSWKGSLSANEACEAIAEGLQLALPHAHITSHPLADGGEGTLEQVHAVLPGEHVFREVTGPLPDRRLPVPWLWWPDSREALVEMALCAGLPLLAHHERDPLRTTTRGVGELLRDALEHGAQTIRLAVGGSATVDGGVGAARALGWRFLDANGHDIPEGGGGLARLSRIKPPADPFPASVEVLCDVTNPLLGPKGAARVFGPQKGAGPADVETLENGLATLARVVREQLHIAPSETPGVGAAGGLAFGALAFLGARLRGGIDTVMDLTRFPERARSADWIVTGEGRFDSQSLDGKVVAGVLRAARAGHANVAVVAGSVSLSPEEAAAAGISFAIGANDDARLPLDEAMRRARELAIDAGRRLGGRILASREHAP